MSKMMKAVVVEQANAPLELTSLPVAEPGPNEVRVKVVASGVNPLDLKIAAGKAPHAKHPFPAILGLDSAGIVDAVGGNVTRFKVGDAVYGLTGGVGGVQGSLAEFIVADADLLAPAPKSIDLRQAASIPLIFITAWEGMVDRAKVSSDKTVLVHGGAGGVGQMAVQIAKAFGADVYATGNASSQETIRELGATPIDYNAQTVDEYVQEHTGGEGFDIVYDTVGGEVLDNSFKAVKTYVGHVVSCLGWGTHSIAPLSFKGATYSGVFTLLPLLTGAGRAHHGEIMQEATKLVEDGKLRVLQDPSHFKLSQANEAHEYQASGKARGKVVIDISEV